MRHAVLQRKPFKVQPLVVLLLAGLALVAVWQGGRYVLAPTAHCESISTLDLRHESTMLKELLAPSPGLRAHRCSLQGRRIRIGLPVPGSERMYVLQLTGMLDSSVSQSYHRSCLINVPPAMLNPVASKWGDSMKAVAGVTRNLSKDPSARIAWGSACPKESGMLITGVFEAQDDRCGKCVYISYTKW